MSHSQFHSIELFILRHAWLNLWDKHMTTGRINQVAYRKRWGFICMNTLIKRCPLPVLFRFSELLHTPINRCEDSPQCQPTMPIHKGSGTPFWQSRSAAKRPPAAANCN